MVNTNCQPCGSNCKKCLNSTYCQICNTNYSALSGGCIACEEPCLRCLSPSVCQECQPAYYLSSAAICYPCLNNCTACENAYVCKKCRDGLYFNGTYFHYLGISCVSCGSYCRECSQDTGACTKCLEGFMVANQSCVGCTGSICSCTVVPSSFVAYSAETGLGFPLFMIIVVTILVQA